MAIKVEDIYKDYPDKVQEYMRNLVDSLSHDYKTIPMSWRVSLDLIADNYNMYLKAKADVDKNGIIIQGSRGTTKNKAIGIMNEAQGKILQLMEAFALTPKSSAKIKKNDKAEQFKDELDELIS